MPMATSLDLPKHGMNGPCHILLFLSTGMVWEGYGHGHHILLVMRVRVRWFISHPLPSVGCRWGWPWPPAMTALRNEGRGHCHPLLLLSRETLPLLLLGGVAMPMATPSDLPKIGRMCPLSDAFSPIVTM